PTSNLQPPTSNIQPPTSNIQPHTMLNQLMELVRDSGQQTVVQNPAVPNEQNEAVLQEASSSIYGGMQQLMQTGGAGALKSLFQGAEQGDMQNPAVQQVANQFSGNLTQKFGFD